MAMNYQFPSEISKFVKTLVVQGRFESEEAAVVEGMRLLMSQERLREEVQKGVKQLDNGDWFDEQAVFDEVEAEVDRIKAAKQGS
jgi:Arc/MetJ-type ribon-helix-helix transcriptional regulator